MLVNLPEPIQQQILFYLEKNYFPAAKKLDDKYVFRFNCENALALELLIYNNCHTSILNFLTIEVSG
jgi:hypothetical protein